MLTQLSTVKARLQLGATSSDDILTAAIAAYSERFDRECNRKFARQENDTYEFHADGRQILLPRYPVESITSFEAKYNETEGWVSLTPSDYLLFKAGGLLTIEDFFGFCCRSIRITYT